jgi:hypothetical protein
LVFDSEDIDQRDECSRYAEMHPMHTHESYLLRAYWRGIEREQYKPLKSPCEVMLPIARACLAIGAAGYITDAEANSRKPRVSPTGYASKWRRR